MDPTPHTPPKDVDFDADRPSRSAAAWLGMRRRRWASLLAFLIGAGLLVAAIKVVLEQQQALGDAMKAAQSAPWWLVLLALALPVINIALTALSFTVVTQRRGRVGLCEMIALIWAASLLNQIPARPGMVGRVVYHRDVNGIRLMDSAKCMGELFLCAIVGTTLLLLVVLACATFAASTRTLILAFMGLTFTLAIATWITKIWGEQRQTGPAKSAWRPNAWRYVAAVLLRFVDVTVWAARYAVVFALLGWSIEIRGAAAIGAAGQAAMMAPIPIGLREWVVGATSAWMPAAYWGPDTPLTGDPAQSSLVQRSTPGLLADVTNRAAELCVMVPGGIVTGAWLMHRWRRSKVGNANGSAASVTAR